MTAWIARIAALIGTTAVLTVACAKATPPVPPPAKQCGAKPSGGGTTPAPATTPSYGLAEQSLWLEVKGLLQTRGCNGCHAEKGWDTYDKAKADLDGIIASLDAEKSSAKFMPKGGERLPLSDRTKFILWKAIGAPKEGNGGFGGDFGSSGGGGNAGEDDGPLPGDPQPKPKDDKKPSDLDQWEAEHPTGATPPPPATGGTGSGFGGGFGSSGNAGC